MAVISDPLGEFKFAEKRENEFENHFDKKIQTNKEMEAEMGTVRSRNRQEQKDGVLPSEIKKRKNNFDEVGISFV